MADIAHAGSLAQEVESLLGDLERRLLTAIQEGARGAREIDDVLSELARLVRETHRAFVRLHETLDRRDLPFETVTRLEGTRKHCLWLYRKSRLEQCFFGKLRLERGLRDSIYRQIIETNQEIAALEEIERELQKREEEALSRELLREPGGIQPSEIP